MGMKQTKIDAKLLLAKLVNPTLTFQNTGMSDMYALRMCKINQLFTRKITLRMAASPATHIFFQQLLTTFSISKDLYK